MKRTLGRKKFSSLVAALCVVLASALPGIANAYWACTSSDGGGCVTYTECQEYRECDDTAILGHWRLMAEANC